MFSSMKYVYEVYKERSFSKAAQNLYISQPSLSATIKKVETRIGSPIFDRSTTPIKLTECGENYIKSIESIMDIQEQFENYITNLNDLKTGHLAIGGSNLFASFVLPPFIAEFTKKYPLIKVSLIEANTPLLEQQLFEGTLDLVIDNYAFSDSIYTKHFFCKEKLLLSVPKSFSSNDMAQKYQLSYDDILNGKHLNKETDSVPLRFFKDDPFIFLRKGNDTRIRSEKICQKNHIEPKIILNLDQHITAYNVSCYGMGIAFVSDTVISKTKPDTNVIYYKLDDSVSIRDVFFYHKQTKYVTRTMEEFLKIATK